MPEPPLVRILEVPLSGMYDKEDLFKHPGWKGCWNWPPHVP